VECHVTSGPYQSNIETEGDFYGRKEQISQIAATDTAVHTPIGNFTVAAQMYFVTDRSIHRSTSAIFSCDMLKTIDVKTFFKSFLVTFFTLFNVFFYFYKRWQSSERQAD